MTNVDDLARLLVPPPGEDVIIRDARILRWNPNTFENVIEYEGIRLRNVDVGAGAAIEASTYQPGDIVQLELRFAGGKKGELGIGDVAIRGRRITPGTGAAEKAVAFMRTELARRLALSIFGEAIRFSVVGASEGTQTTGGNWVDLATPGPIVDDVTIGETGRALVIVGGLIHLTSSTGSGGQSGFTAGFMSFEISGATTREPDLFDRTVSLASSISTTITSFLGLFPWVDSCKATVVEGLNPGSHRFKVRYAAVADGPGFTAAEFSNRILIVIPF